MSGNVRRFNHLIVTRAPPRTFIRCVSIVKSPASPVPKERVNKPLGRSLKTPLSSTDSEISQVSRLAGTQRTCDGYRFIFDSQPPGLNG